MTFYQTGRLRVPGFLRISKHAWLWALLLVLLCPGLAACASNAGVFSGGNWQASGLGNQHIQVLAVDPEHVQDIFAGSTLAGVFVSTNAGVSWKQSDVGLPASLAVNALAFDTSGQKLYAATSMGLFVSANLGASWTHLAQAPVDDYSALSFDVNTPQVVYAASAHAGVLLSRDGGQSWTSLGKSVFTGALTSVLYDANQKILWAATASSIYRSSDNGASWQLTNTGLPGNGGINTLVLGAVTSGSSDLVFAGTNHGFFITSDAGQHWTQSQFSLANLKVSAVLLDATQPTVVYAATDIGVLRSSDSGQTWGPVGTGLPNNQVFTSLAQGDVNNGQLFVAGQGIYRYPGTSSGVDPTRVLPALLILLFFLFLYFFFTMRRRRRPARSLPPNEPEDGGPGEPPGGHALNGHKRLPEDEQPER